MSKATILVADDEELIRWSLREALKREGYEVLEAASGRDALEQFKLGPDLVLLDYRLPDIDGFSVLRELKRADPDALVILLTSLVSVDTAVEAMKLGAYHFANKPFNIDEIAATIGRALETTRLRREVRQLREHEARPYSLRAIVGESDAMASLRQMVAKVAASPASTVLLTGESGTGKDLVAKTIHYSSARASRPFMNITCSALPEPLLEGELFGHERGAFTDARAQKRGLLESADGGTVFLDEIGEMDPALQGKLLRFLEEKSFKRVGGAADIRVDVRVVAATNRNLEEQVLRGHFRSDLYYRLNVLPIRLPPLREHAAEVPILVAFFRRHLQSGVQETDLRCQPRGSRAARVAWVARERPRAAQRRRACHAAGRRDPARGGGLRRAEDRAGAGDPFDLPAAGVNLEELERGLVLQALRRVHGNQTKAAALLGLHRDQVRYRIDKFGLAAVH